MNSLYLKSKIVNSPIEWAVRWLRNASERRANLELAEIVLEEQRVPLLLRRLLTKLSKIVDVGGHIGSFISLAPQIAPDGRHTILEASPSNPGGAV